MKDFTYNAENHTGYFKDKLVPSITQLVSILFPMDSNIKKSVLENASIRGTAIHNDIDEWCCGEKDHCETEEGKNFELLLKTYDFVPVKSEFTLYFRDKEGNIIAYGHADQLLKANSYVYLLNEKIVVSRDTPTNENAIILYKPNDLILSDNKTVAQFDNEKVETQLNLYSVGETEDGERIKVNHLIGIWVREETRQIRPLTLVDEKTARTTLEYLVGVFHDTIRN